MVVLPSFRMFWYGTLCKQTLDCAFILSYASKLSFCIIYLPMLHAIFVNGKDI